MSVRTRARAQRSASGPPAFCLQLQDIIYVCSSCLSWSRCMGERKLARLDRHWPHVVGGCIRSAPELSRRPPACRCSSRRCDEGRCRRCRPFDSCAPRMVGGAQQSTLRPLDRAAANLAAAGTMESCAMILRAVHPWGLARPSKMSVPGELLAAVRKGGRPMRPTLACDQWLCWQHRGHHRRCRAQRAASGTVRSFTTLPR